MGKFFDTCGAYDRNEAVLLLGQEFLDNGTKNMDAADVAEAWTGAEFPERACDADMWEVMFGDVGVHDVVGRPVEVEDNLTVFRGAHPAEHETGEYGCA